MLGGRMAGCFRSRLESALSTSSVKVVRHRDDDFVCEGLWKKRRTSPQSRGGEMHAVARLTHWSERIVPGRHNHLRGKRELRRVCASANKREAMRVQTSLSCEGNMARQRVVLSSLLVLLRRVWSASVTLRLSYPMTDGARMKFRSWLCHVLSIAKLHRPDCEHCNPLWRCRGFDMQKRLEELSQEPPRKERLEAVEMPRLRSPAKAQGDRDRRVSREKPAQV